MKDKYYKYVYKLWNLLDGANKVGIEEFEDLFGSIRYYYVDKTRFIKEAMEDSFQCGLFTRPRRFGKTLWMTTLKSFLSINYCDPNDLSRKKDIFKDLDIARGQPPTA